LRQRTSGRSSDASPLAAWEIDGGDQEVILALYASEVVLRVQMPRQVAIDIGSSLLARGEALDRPLPSDRKVAVEPRYAKLTHKKLTRGVDKSQSYVPDDGERGEKPLDVVEPSGVARALNMIARGLPGLLT
jgi:hypothetical protein